MHIYTGKKKKGNYDVTFAKLFCRKKETSLLYVRADFVIIVFHFFAFNLVCIDRSIICQL